MKLVLILLLSSSLSFAQGAGGKAGFGGKGGFGGGVATIGTPTINFFRGKDGSHNGGAGSSVNNLLFNLEPSTAPNAVSSGSFIAMIGAWPDSQPGSAPPACASHCLPTFTDDKSNTWNHVFSTTSPCTDGTNDYGIYYVENAIANTSQIKETHPAKILITEWDVINAYNMATSSSLTTSSCLNNQTPINNTAPNLTGSGISVIAGQIVLVGVMNQNVGLGGNIGNFVSSTTMPSPGNATCLYSGASPGTEGGFAHYAYSCLITSSGTFTPQFTVAQTTHDPYTIIAAAFNPGSGGSPPSAGAAILAQTQLFKSGNSVNQTLNVPCPSGTQTLAITDDAGILSSITDSGSNTYVSVTTAGGGNVTYYKTGITIANQNTFTVTLHANASGGNSIIGFSCLNTSGLDTAYAAGAAPNLQATPSSGSSSTVFGCGPGSAGSCANASAGGALGTYTNLPTGTTGSTGDLLLANCAAGSGPYLQSSQPNTVMADFVGPAAIADIIQGDFLAYLNGDMLGHYYAPTAASVNMGWTIQNNSAAYHCIVTAFK